MKMVVQGRNIDVTDAINQYVHEKIEKATSHFSHLSSEVDINLSVEKNPRISSSHSAEVTLYANGKVIRAHESSENMYASIDRVADKLARQLRKFKERNRTDKKKQSTKTSVAVTRQVPVVPPDASKTPELPPEIVRSKYFSMPPMTVDEALHQLDLVDDDFFMFRNQETDEINVIYERNHGGFGVICPRN
ncbi:MAG: ribosome-associated translation inhibitor RaiA [Cyanobacteria bacterium J06649_11]